MKWRKSSYSGQSGGNCIEVADQGNRVLVRDSKNRVGAMLRFTPDAWRRFADQVKGERSLASDSPSASVRGALSCLGALPFASTAETHETRFPTTLVMTRLRRMQYRPGLLEGFLAKPGLDLTPFILVQEAAVEIERVAGQAVPAWCDGSDPCQAGPCDH